MYRVATSHLSPDATTASVALEPMELGELSRADLVALLERFRELDSGQNHEADPHLIVHGRAGKFLIRTGRRKLFLYNARDTVEPYAELTPDEIIATLERENVTVAPFGTGTPADTPATGSTKASAPHRGIAAAILIVGLALNGYTLYAVFYTESVNEQPVVTLVTDAADLAIRRNSVVGRYATGDKPGDRTITVQPDGSVIFSEIGSTNRVLNNTDTYSIGRREKKFCLTTGDSGLIDIVDIDTLVYYRDTYKRK